MLNPIEKGYTVHTADVTDIIVWYTCDECGAIVSHKTLEDHRSWHQKIAKRLYPLMKVTRGSFIR